MTYFEDKLSTSAKQLASEDNKRLRVPANPLSQKASYWGWVATPAAAVAGIVLGMSLDAFVGDKPSVRFVQTTDTVEVVRPVHDTLYLTQVVEKERIVERPVYVRQTVDTIEQEDTLACTSIQCDGINYALLTLK
ncbi:MAG: hypothetical protein IKQ37_10030 [Bacteroidaceae bacterium]|nr:hypothetical protein [Bacteroidaceae bacterium]